MEHVILDAGLRGHEAIVGAIAGNERLYIFSKVWQPRPDNANNGRVHTDFLKEISEMRASLVLSEAGEISKRGRSGLLASLSSS